MMKYNTLNFWTEEEELSPTQNVPSQEGAEVANQEDPASMNKALEPQADDGNQNTADPNAPEPLGELAPDMPEEDDNEALENFESWKIAFFKDSIHSDVNSLIESINKIRDENLDSYQRKFVEDNLQILFLRQNSNIEKANKEIRKLIRAELDENNPSVSLINHLESIFKKNVELNNVLIKIKGTLGMKSDLHRKFLSSLLGCVQVGNGADNEDIIYNDTNYSIKISTRFNEKWGKLELGKWYLKVSDPESFLDEAELKRMQEGSPEEREVLKKRVIVDSISEHYKERSFISNIVSNDGTIHFLGIDINSCIASSYNEGKVVVKFTNSDNNECSLDSDGNISAYVSVKISCLVDTDELDENGFPKKEELDFMEKVNGSLFLTASLDTMKKVSGSMNGIIFKELPYNGNPSDIQKIQRCVPSANEILMRSC